MSQAFTDQLSECNTRESLVQLMESIDFQRMTLSTEITQLSSQPLDGMSGQDAYSKLRRMRDKRSYLFSERGLVRQKLSKLNNDVKAVNRANDRQPGFSQAFLAACERSMSQSEFLDMEVKAMELMG